MKCKAKNTAHNSIENSSVRCLRIHGGINLFASSGEAGLLHLLYQSCYKPNHIFHVFFLIHKKIPFFIIPQPKEGELFLYWSLRFYEICYFCMPAFCHTCVIHSVACRWKMKPFNTRNLTWRLLWNIFFITIK